MIRFANWWFLFIIPVVIYLFTAIKKRRGLKFSSVKLLKQSKNKRPFKYKIGKTLIISGVVLSVAALARPQSAINLNLLSRQGIDIAILLDVSGSMQSVDFEPNRLEAARKTIDDFISRRAADRISLIVFAGAAYTRIPLTLDNNVVRESLAKVTPESVNEDGTAVGMAVSVGINRLKKSSAPSRIMILITDGDNNAGAVDPATASNLARDLGICIYTIGVGSDTMILPAQDIMGRTYYQQYPGGFDEALLEKIADTTGGRYFYAADPEALQRIFDNIDQLEKTKFDDDDFKEYSELAFPLIAAALLLLTAGIFFDKYYFIQIP